MYKLLLSWRYLRTRWIALASIISVTLGVATLIVVNSVMAGFGAEMNNRLHGILSDIVVESVGFDGMYDPVWHEREIRRIVGDDLAGITSIVRVPAMINFQVRGRWITQQVVLIGIDDKSYANVSDFRKYLLHPKNRQQISFQLREGGYDQQLPTGSGWEYRRQKVAAQRAFEQSTQLPRGEPIAPADNPDDDGSGIQFRPLPKVHPLDRENLPDTFNPRETTANQQGPADVEALSPETITNDPFGRTMEENVFDESREQHTGVILGIALASYRARDGEQQVRDEFLCRPGDNIQITLPNSGTPPRPVNDTFTIVDFYQSKMSEYDASFAFVPLSKLQDLRGMVDPTSGVSRVTSIQIKLKEDANLEEVRDKLRKRFPPELAPYRIQTWKELQGPLLAAVSLETMLLNILLFLIIAVAGFGILATFFMIVVEKTRDIGILKALGAPSRGVMSIFLSYGLSLGIVGSGMGLVLGLLFVAYINDIAALIGTITGKEVFDQTVYYFEKIPAIVEPVTVVWVAVGSTAIAVMASVLPAIRAARLHPVEALRYE